MKKTAATLALAFSIVGGSACASTDAAPDNKAEEGDAPIDGKLDGWNVSDQGALTWSPLGRDRFSISGRATISSTSRALGWTFTLSDDATVGLNTQPAMPGDSDVDTVMYLYERNAQGTWGRYIERNDDTSSRNFWSKIRGIELGSGTYRIVVKGYGRADTGRVGLAGTCTGPGCVAAEVTEDFVAGFNAVKDKANYMSESDYSPVLLQGTRSDSNGITLPEFQTEFAQTFAQWFTRENDTTVRTSQLAYDEWDQETVEEFLAGLHDEQGDGEDEESEAAWATIHTLMNGLTDLRAIEVGVKNEDGSFDPDNPGLAALCFVGRNADGKIVGFYVGAVWT